MTAFLDVQPELHRSFRGGGEVSGSVIFLLVLCVVNFCIALANALRPTSHDRCTHCGESLWWSNRREPHAASPSIPPPWIRDPKGRSVSPFAHTPTESGFEVIQRD
jgi:hypothetical protein